MLVSEKKKFYSGYRKLNERRKDLLAAKNNADRILGISKDASAQNISHTRQRNTAHEL